MASHSRVYNVTKGCSCKFRAAEKAVDNCSAMWVEYGVSIRNLTLEEGRAALIAQAKKREPLPFAELPGIRFYPPARALEATRNETRLAWEAHEFVRQAA